MQSLQYVYEEKVMTGSTATPPWLLIGMEGFFGILTCTVYPLAGIIASNGHGFIEYMPNMIAQNQNSVPVHRLPHVAFSSTAVARWFGLAGGGGGVTGSNLGGS
mmetsp:Transcript_28878/g.88572  ORF Transcript_28878/g.88572 Transcript_28878/m.88572 type:complete len:104 (-) Transcript_28878:192-503(-)